MATPLRSYRSSKAESCIGGRGKAASGGTRFSATATCRRPDIDDARKDGAVAYADIGSDRRAVVERYIDEVFSVTGKRITRTEIWKAAGDKTRAEFERWESCWYERRGKKTNKAAQRRYIHLLTKEKPHLK
jgi:hypothetical protein